MSAAKKQSKTTNTKQDNVIKSSVTGPVAAQPAPTYNDSLFKKIFYGSLIFMVVSLMIAGYGSGVCYDELTMNVYGKANISFYTSGGRDTSFMAPKFADRDGAGDFIPVNSYGSLFEYMGIGLNAVTGNLNGYEYNNIHMLNQLFAIIGVLFTGLIARRITGKYITAVIASWLLFLTPTFFGLSIFDIKDVPFLTGYIATIYFMILFMESLPRPSWKVSMGFMLSLFFALSIRIGGILLMMYGALFLAIYWLSDNNLKKDLFANIKYWLPKLTVIIAGALILTIVAWPFVLLNPVTNLIKAVTIVSKFPQKINIVFEGNAIDSLHLPTWYLTKCMFITIPALILVSLFVSPALTFSQYRKYKVQILSLLLFSSLFPIAYAIYTHASMYNLWRHFLFIYPGLIIVDAIGIGLLFDRFKKNSYKLAFAALLLLCMINPITWILRTTPYQYVYFNEFTGGIKKVFHDYEKDSWAISVKDAVDWLIKTEHLKERKDTVTIATNDIAFVHYYIKRSYPGYKIKIIPASIKNRNIPFWNYAILYNVFLDANWEENYFPPKQTIHTIDIDEMPLTAIVKDIHRYDFKAFLALQHNDFHAADSLYSLHLKEVNYNLQVPTDLGGIAGYIGYAKMALQQYPEAISFAKNAINTNPNDCQGYITLGATAFMQRNFRVAKQNLIIALQLSPKNTLAKLYLSKIK